MVCGMFGLVCCVSGVLVVLVISFVCVGGCEFVGFDGILCLLCWFFVLVCSLYVRCLVIQWS